LGYGNYKPVIRLCADAEDVERVLERNVLSYLDEPDNIAAGGAGIAIPDLPLGVNAETWVTLVVAGA